jgi:predicted RNA-binding Zn-ribbon protein involved in translation (DUF1610 family)
MIETREQWLIAAVAQLEQTLPFGPIPLVKVSCGWPSKKALAKKSRNVGEHWDKSFSRDGQFHYIHISPFLDDPGEILETLVHELCHACLPHQTKAHGKEFAALAGKVGLEKPWSEAPATKDTMIKLRALALGPYPHSGLDTVKIEEENPPEKSRALKAECPKCGYIIRTTKKWLENAKLPICGDCGVSFCAADTASPIESP